MQDKFSQFAAILIVVSFDRADKPTAKRSSLHVKSCSDERWLSYQFSLWHSFIFLLSDLREFGFRALKRQRAASYLQHCCGGIPNDCSGLQEHCISKKKKKKKTLFSLSTQQYHARILRNVIPTFFSLAFYSQLDQLQLSDRRGTLLFVSLYCQFTLITQSINFLLKKLERPIVGVERHKRGVNFYKRYMKGSLFWP